MPANAFPSLKLILSAETTFNASLKLFAPPKVIFPASVRVTSPVKVPFPESSSALPLPFLITSVFATFIASLALPAAPSINSSFSYSLPHESAVIAEP